jgi:hypothetical protein
MPSGVGNTSGAAPPQGGWQNSIDGLVDLVGDFFINSQNQSITADHFFHVEKYIGLYFGCQWAPPCQEFTPILTDFYNKVNDRNKRIEIVYIHSDENMQQF